MPPSDRLLEAFAPAKINLWLHVTGRRADGLHELDSLVTFADVGDRLSIAPADELSLTVSGPFAAALGTAAENLVLRAARALALQCGVPAEAALHLEKNLPVASGIGGGSADAAAALRLCVRLWQVEIEEAALGEVALGLGADVPVCLAGETVRMTGIGERLAPLVPPPTPTPAVLINPGVAVSTGQVFGALAGTLFAAGRCQGRRFFGACPGQPQRSRSAGYRACAGNRGSPGRPARRAGAAAGAHVGQRRHLLRPVRPRRGGGGSGARHRGSAPVLVGRRLPDRPSGLSGRWLQEQDQGRNHDHRAQRQAPEQRLVHPAEKACAGPGAEDEHRRRESPGGRAESRSAASGIRRPARLRARRRRRSAPA